jgi:hypothetical protein
MEAGRPVADLVVDLGDLARTARRLDDALGVARQVHDHGAGLADQVEDYGATDLGKAVRHFLDEWSYGCGLLADDASALVGMLDQAVATYQAADAAAAGAAASLAPPPVVLSAVGGGR